MTPRTIKFDDKKWDKLTAIAQERGTTNAALVREAVYAFIQNNKDRK